MFFERKLPCYPSNGMIEGSQALGAAIFWRNLNELQKFGLLTIRQPAGNGRAARQTRGTRTRATAGMTIMLMVSQPEL